MEMEIQAPKYEVLLDQPATEDGFYRVKILEGEFTGAVFSFGKVAFPNEEDNVMSFEYNLETDKPENIKDLENTIGNILTSLIMNAIKNSELVFKGGTE